MYTHEAKKYELNTFLSSENICKVESLHSYLLIKSISFFVFDGTLILLCISAIHQSVKYYETIGKMCIGCILMHVHKLKPKKGLFYPIVRRIIKVQKAKNIQRYVGWVSFVIFANLIHFSTKTIISDNLLHFYKMHQRQKYKNFVCCMYVSHLLAC